MTDRFPFKIEWPHTIHELKTIDPYFDAVRMGAKTFEIRKDDRGFQPGDLLVLRHWVPERGYTGQHVEKVASYVMRDAERFGLAAGFVVLGLQSPPPSLACTYLGAVQ